MALVKGYCQTAFEKLFLMQLALLDPVLSQAAKLCVDFNCFRNPFAALRDLIKDSSQVKESRAS